MMICVIEKRIFFLLSFLLCVDMSASADLCDLLHSYYMDSDYQREEKNNLLISAASSGNLKFVKKIIEEGADIDAADKGGLTALNRAAHFGHFLILQYLAREGANIHIADREGITPLLRVAARGALSEVQYLTDKGANVNQPHNGGWTPLMYAAERGFLQVVQWLICKGADIHAVNRDKGTTALHIAALNYHLPIVEYLVKKGANVNHFRSGGYSIMYDLVEKAIDFHFWENKDTALFIIRYLAQSGADVGRYRNPLCLTIDRNEPDLSLFLIQCGADISDTTRCGRTMLWEVVNCSTYMMRDNKHLCLIKCLIEKGADIEVVNQGQTLFSLAEKSENKDIVEYFRNLKKERDVLIVAKSMGFSNIKDVLSAILVKPVIQDFLNTDLVGDDPDLFEKQTDAFAKECGLYTLKYFTQCYATWKYDNYVVPIEEFLSNLDDMMFLYLAHSFDDQELFFKILDDVVGAAYGEKRQALKDRFDQISRYILNEKEGNPWWHQSDNEQGGDKQFDSKKHD